MRKYDCGAFVCVAVSEAEVSAFARRWPCFGDVRRGMVFEFERNGDLVGLEGDEGLDAGGVVALAQDAAIFAGAK